MTNRLLKKLKGPASTRRLRRGGFTLVETLGAVLLLSIALAGPMVIAEKGLQTSLISKDQNTAFNLAQDAIEYVRWARDTNCLAAAASSLVPCPGGTTAPSWVNNSINLTPCVSTDGSSACYIDSTNSVAPTICTGGICPSINYDSANNIFSYSAGTASIFTRTVQITYNASCSTTCNPSEADLTVTVSWNDPVMHSIQVNESLYDWQ